MGEEGEQEQEEGEYDPEDPDDEAEAEEVEEEAEEGEEAVEEAEEAEEEEEETEMFIDPEDIRRKACCNCCPVRCGIVLLACWIALASAVKLWEISNTINRFNFNSYERYQVATICNDCQSDK